VNPLSAIAAPLAAMSTANPEAEKHRLAGNEHFKMGRFEQAIAAYSAAIEVEPSASLLSNRAFANIKLCFSGEAIADADRALEMDPGFAKARYRKASAYLQLGKVTALFYAESLFFYKRAANQKVHEASCGSCFDQQ
jgi:tetratricopeptide (TPR) repeat protein